MKAHRRIAFVVGLFAIGVLAAGELIAADEKSAELKCPVCGMAGDPAYGTEWEGAKVIFCGDGCVDAFKKDPSKYAAKAHLQQVKSGQLVQKACPLTGRPMKAESSVEVAGVNVAFCCNNCKGKVEKASGDEQVNIVFKDVSKGYKPAGS